MWASREGSRSPHPPHAPARHTPRSVRSSFCRTAKWRLTVTNEARVTEESAGAEGSAHLS